MAIHATEVQTVLQGIGITAAGVFLKYGPVKYQYARDAQRDTIEAQERRIAVLEVETKDCLANNKVLESRLVSLQSQYDFISDLVKTSVQSQLATSAVPIKPSEQ